MKLLDTIAAISTPFGKGGVAMIRISGDRATAVADKIFRRASKEPLSKAARGKMCYGEIYSPDSDISIDDGMAVVFGAPHSFTGEDVVEIYCHGGILVTQRVLSAALAQGARSAEAGEFTRRAFINGKMSLSGARSLGDLLDAENENQVRLARNGMRGHLDGKIEHIYSLLRNVMTSILANIDFPDEDLAELDREGMIELVGRALGDVQALIGTYGTGRAVQSGIKTVICGRANAGKSSMYNAIVGYDAAIVTDVEGTTRDVLTQKASLGRTTLLLCDTAGIRESSDAVESIGIDRAQKALAEAELALAVFDVSCDLTADDRMLIEKVKAYGGECIALLNKTDLGICAHTEGELAASFDRRVYVSAKNAQGLDTLADAIDSLFVDGRIDIDRDAIVTGAEQHASLISARELLDGSLCELRAGAPLDLCCVGIEGAMSALGRIDGREVGEQIVAEIFSKFCVGK